MTPASCKGCGERVYLAFVPGPLVTRESVAFWAESDGTAHVCDTRELGGEG